MSGWLWLLAGFLLGILGTLGGLLFLGRHLTTEGARQREWDE